MPRTTKPAETVQHPRPGPPGLRTSSSSGSTSSHQRSRFPDNRSPRLLPSDPKQKKKLGTRIANLESQLGQAQDELKCLKSQLASAEPVKKKAQTHQQEVLPSVVEMQEGSGKKQSVDGPEALPEMDVFEVVPVEKVSSESKGESNETGEQEGQKDDTACLSKESQEYDEIIISLRAKIEEKEAKLESFHQENENLKARLNEECKKISSAQSQIEELTSKLRQAEQELETSRINSAETTKNLEAAEKGKQELENEMKTLRVQTEQWRKAADAAAYFLSGGMETSACGGRRVSERCGSMDKVYYGSPFESFVGPYGYKGSMDSPGLIDEDDPDDVYGGGKKKSPSSGIRMFGDLWKKKGRK